MCENKRNKKSIAYGTIMRSRIGKTSRNAAIIMVIHHYRLCYSTLSGGNAPFGFKYCQATAVVGACFYTTHC